MALAAMEAYLDRLGIELHAESHIFRTRSGTPYSKDTLGDDFRDVRRAVFGECENALWQTFAEVVLMRQLRAMLNPRPSHTPWGTPYTPQMPCSARIAL